jgi:hypothetical protein
MLVAHGRTSLIVEGERPVKGDVDSVWSRIRAHQGETFVQIRGGRFTYQVLGGSIVLDRTNRQIPKSDIETALNMVPFESTVPLQRLQAPSYIYAILMDSRIREGEW